MIAVGFSPSVRLFEAGACGVPIISDSWEGLDTFFIPGSEILVARSAEEVTEILLDMSETERAATGARARAAVLARHTAAHRVLELEGYFAELGNPVVPVGSAPGASAYESGFGFAAE
jgi:spore maturation protein CgeB